jgi:pantoate--beta-alanine ligase
LTPEALFIEMYRPNHSTFVDVGPIGRVLEGEFRPTHFRGVATIVLKLLNLAPAERAYFGRKDYQQTLVVRQMVADLNVPAEVRVCPIVREPDGLAMSSRNAYLSAEERQRALALSRSLRRHSSPCWRSAGPATVAWTPHPRRFVSEIRSSALAARHRPSP